MHGRTWRHLVGSVRVVQGCAVRGMVVVCDVSFGRFGCVHVFGLEVVEGPLFFFFWHIGACKNRLDWAFWDTCSTVNALIRVDYQIGICLPESLDWAYCYAFLILVVDTT